MVFGKQVLFQDLGKTEQTVRFYQQLERPVLGSERLGRCNANVYE